MKSQLPLFGQPENDVTESDRKTPKLIHADCLEAMREMEANSIDAIVTDPPYGLAFMGKGWDHGVPGVPFWTEALRVAKPGAHLVAFGGTRTYHRLACAIEDAGWEVRDCLSWLYGSGFPKSLDVSKALDKASGRMGVSTEALKHKLIELFDASGKSRGQIDDECGFRACNYLTLPGKDKRPDPWINVLPSQEKWGVIKRVLGCASDPEVEATLDRFFAEAEREVFGSVTKARSVGQGFALPTMGADTEYKTWDITAPATDAAKQWQGWGTALKPAWEPIILARKPLGTLGTNVVAVVESALRRQGVIGEILWKPDDAKAAEKSRSTRTSSSTEQQRTEATSAANAVERGTPSTDPLTAPSTENGGISGPPRTPAGPEKSLAQANESSATKCSTPTEARVPAVGSGSGTSSPSTTSTAGVQRTGEPHTERSTRLSEGQASHPTTESFAGIATGLTGSTAHVHIERDSDGFFVWPAGLPRSVAGGSPTVAANVLAHGTGAINVDACRIGDFQNVTPSGVDRRNAKLHELGYRPGEYPTGADERAPSTPPGRWPANVALDEEAAAMLDEQTGDRPSTLTGRAEAGQRHDLPRDNKSATGYHGGIPAGRVYADSGGASRFFYTAKASRRERGEGNTHPTVKPIALMRWLAKLVTPPGGVILDPFCGSGTTLLAAQAEGFDAVGIEREAEYVEIARKRIEGAGDPK